jgi:hypothetical protein
MFVSLKQPAFMARVFRTMSDLRSTCHEKIQKCGLPEISPG